MANELISNETSATQLAAGIVSGIQKLLKQHVALLEFEIKADIQTAKRAGILLAWSYGIVLIGAILLSWTFVFLLSWAIPVLPLWVCCGMAGLPTVALGIMLHVFGVHKLDSIQPLSGESAQALKESLQWLSKPK